MPQKGFVGLIQTAGKEQRMNLGATANSWVEIRLWRIHKELRNKKQKQQMQTTHLSCLLFQCISANLVLFAFLYSWDSVQFSCSVMSTPWTTARQDSLSITNSRSPTKPISIESVMPSNHLIFCHPLLLLPSILPSISIFSNKSALHMRWPKYWSFSFNISPSNEHPGLISLGWTGWISLQSKGLARVFSNTTVQKHQFSGAQLSL